MHYAEILGDTESRPINPPATLNTGAEREQDQPDDRTPEEAAQAPPGHGAMSWRSHVQLSLRVPADYCRIIHVNQDVTA